MTRITETAKVAAEQVVAIVAARLAQKPETNWEINHGMVNNPSGNINRPQ